MQSTAMFGAGVDHDHHSSSASRTIDTEKKTSDGFLVRV